MEVEKILGPGTVEDVLKPTHHYAYFDLSGDLVAHKVMHRLRKVLINFKIDVFPLYHGVPKRYLNMYSHLRRSIAEMRGKNGTRVANAGDRKKFGNQFGEHNAHRCKYPLFLIYLAPVLGSMVWVLVVLACSQTNRRNS